MFKTFALSFSLCSCVTQYQEPIQTRLGGQLLEHVSVISLGDQKIDVDEFRNTFELTVARWQLLFPDAQWDLLYNYLQDNPLGVVFAPGYISCSHSGGEDSKILSLCSGLLPSQGVYLFVQKLDAEHICHTALAHELSHFFGWALLHDADGAHSNAKIWTDVVEYLHDDCDQ